VKFSQVNLIQTSNVFIDVDFDKDKTQKLFNFYIEVYFEIMMLEYEIL
jgi:hypothetical protein